LAVVFFILTDRLPEPYRHLWVALAFAAVFAISEYLQNYFRIHGQINLSLVPREIVWRGASILGIAAVGFIGYRADGEVVMAIVTVLLGTTTLYQAVAFLRGEGWGWLSRHDDVPRETRRIWRTESLYFIANNVLNSSSAYLETILIGAVLGLDKAGFYFVALRIAMLLTLPVTAIDTVGIPMIAARFQKSDSAGAQILIGRLSFASFCISLLGALVLAMIAPFVLSIFNADFVQHANVLTALCVLSVSQAFFGPGSWLLMIGGGERFFLIARGVIFVFYLGLLYGLAQIGGLMGIAIAGLFMTLASNLAAWHWIKRKYAIDNMATAFFRPFIFAGPTEPKPVQSSPDGRADAAAKPTAP
jgi:O-antigen/teichoic acid export membrane protein